VENQHRKIKGYRELSEEEIDLMNRIKAKGAELLQLQADLVGMIEDANRAKMCAIDEAVTIEQKAEALSEINRFNLAGPHRWAAIGKTDIETGIMALVRAVAQPA
jgi:hypothetical protein